MTTPDEPQEGRWAKPVEHLEVGDLPDEALNLNVEGRALSGAVQGFGPLWQKTYQIRLHEAKVTPQELIEVWKAEYPNFWPDNSNMYRVMARLEPGDVGVINASQSGLKLSTGVYVMYSDDVSFAFAVPQGHMLSGWITFSAHDDDGSTVAQVQPYFRTSDPLYDLAFKLYFDRKEDEIWHHTLRAIAERFGVKGDVQQESVRIDKKRQWRRAGNIRYNAGIHSSIYMATTPFRWVGRKVRGSR